MIISHHHKFVFLRSCKTGSTSTALALRKSGILDLQSDVSNFVEGPIADRFHCPVNMPSALPPDSRFAEVAPHTLVWLNPAKRVMHLNLPELVGLGFLTARQAREYAVYVGIREPVDKMVSAANFLLKRAPRWLFKQHDIEQPASVQDVFDRKIIDVIMPILALPQSHWFRTDRPENLRYILFDDLQNEVARLVTRFGGTWSADQMPEKKSGIRDRRTEDAENLLRPETVAELQETYRRDYRYWEKAKERRSGS
jgi:hypothetical protein